MQKINPFEITKAVDFTDQEITDYWVDFSDSSFLEIIKPNSPMPMIVLGGKGSGKTHLMRYFSYASQKIRHSNILDGLSADGYIGIYMRCGGLNASRFGSYIGEDEKKWLGVFSFYMDLWLSQLAIKTVIDVFKLAQKDVPNEKDICRNIYRLFGGFANSPPEQNLTLKLLLEFLIDTHKNIDVAVNNYPFSGDLDVVIATSPGELVFSIPEILSEYIPEMKNILFSYFIDEFENLAEIHQVYINTLVREKRLPCSFKIGSRLYGIKTYSTYSDGEINRNGSEFETLHLDSILRNKTKAKYKQFSKNLCLRRLSEAGYIYADPNGNFYKETQIDDFFRSFPKDKFSEEATNYSLKNYSEKDRPYIAKLRNKLAEFYSTTNLDNSEQPALIDTIIKNIAYKSNPMIEKANIFLLYQDWSSNKNVLSSSKKINSFCTKFKETGKLGKRHETAISHFGGDFLAQMVRESGLKQLYTGLDSFVAMSSGLPRNLLIVLKHVFQWSLYNGEKPFRDTGLISISAQRKGVLEAANWFLRDSRMKGSDGKLVRAGVSNLATLLRNVRFSDKPSECSLSTFSVDISKVTEETFRIIDLAENWSLLINIPGGRKDRNSGAVVSKYQLNPMLAPIWDLPLSRRGVIALNPDEVNSIFDTEFQSEFDSYCHTRLERMTAPKFRERNKKMNAFQTSFLDFGDD